MERGQRKRKREKGQWVRFPQEKHPHPKTSDWGIKRNHHRFLQTVKLRFCGFRIRHHLAESSKAGSTWGGGGLQVEEDRGPGADSRQHGVGIP